jgi:hypothetical protein
LKRAAQEYQKLPLIAHFRAFVADRDSPAPVHAPSEIVVFGYHYLLDPLYVPDNTYFVYVADYKRDLIVHFGDGHTIHLQSMMEKMPPSVEDTLRQN